MTAVPDCADVLALLPGGFTGDAEDGFGGRTKQMIASSLAATGEKSSCYSVPVQCRDIDGFMITSKARILWNTECVSSWEATSPLGRFFEMPKQK